VRIPVEDKFWLGGGGGLEEEGPGQE